MAYSLRATGLAAIATSVVALDDDGVTVRDFASAIRTANMTVHPNVLKGASTWKGTSRGYFQTMMTGAYSHEGIAFAAGFEIPHLNGYVDPGTSLFVASAGSGPRGGNGAMAGPYQMPTGTLRIAYGSHDGISPIPSDTTTKFSMGMNFVYGSTWTAFFGLESGSLAADGTGTDGGYGFADKIARIGGDPGQGTAPGRYHLFATFPRPLTLAEQQSLHNDWFGTLFVQPAPTLRGNANLDNMTASGIVGGSSGKLTTPVLKNNAGTILANVTGVVVNVYHPLTGVLIVRKIGLTSNASGVVVIQDSLITPTLSYAVEIDLSATVQGRRLPILVGT